MIPTKYHSFKGVKSKNLGPFLPALGRSLPNTKKTKNSSILAEALQFS
jgi:hypothetical protein